MSVILSAFIDNIPYTATMLSIVPVIASGGAGCINDFVTLFNTLPKVDAGLAASIFHFGEVKISDLKNTLHQNNIPVRR